MKWRIINTGKNDSAMNMAIDEAIMLGIMAGTSLPTIRFYDWDPATVSCGYNQDVAKEVDFEAVEKGGYGFVRRPTGGRLVLHEKEITYSVIAPADGRLGGSVLESYGVISKALARGMELLGVGVEFEKGNLTAHHQRQQANPCFTSSSRLELKYDNRKIVGSAQVRKNNVLLQHGSILLHQNQEKIAYLVPGLSAEQRAKLASFLKRKTVAINEITSETVSFEQAADSFGRGFIESWSEDEFEFHNCLTRVENESSAELKKSKYLTVKWNKNKAF